MERILLLAVFGLLPLGSGCAHMTHSGRGALVGSGLGAATGAIIGNQSGNSGGGALIGAAAGALGGALLGQTHDAMDDRDAALARAYSAEQHAAFQQTALSNTDVILMAQNGLGPDVIVNSIRTRGGQFDTSPPGLIALKQNGVPDSVIAVMQQTPSGPIHQASGNAYGMPPQRGRDVIFVEPEPVPIYLRGPRRLPPPGWHRHRRFHDCGPSFSIGIHN